MSHHDHAATSAAPVFTVAAWDERQPLSHAELDDIIADARVIGIGESAHFVAEHHHARASLVEALIQSGVTGLALEIGHDEAPLIEQWLAGHRPEELRALVGSLTTALYGTFLEDLRGRLPRGHGIRVLGVDLPNSLSITASLTPLAEIVNVIDPASAELIESTRELASRVVGGSAAASATSWLSLDAATQDALSAHLASARARLDAMKTVHSAGADAHLWRHAGDLIHAAVTTDAMLRAMADMFSGIGRIDDTTIREVFVATRVREAVDGLSAHERIAYVAHNNHIQKTPVVFDGVLTAYPAGSLLANSLKSAYRAIALTHTDAQVPEMSFPASTDVGFRVERVDAAPLGENNVEHASVAALRSTNAAIVRWAATSEERVIHLRSQSATTELTTNSFDAAVVFASATTDESVRALGID